MINRSLVTPRDWQLIAIQQAINLAGTPEAPAKFAEAKRYAVLAELIEDLEMKRSTKELESNVISMLKLAKTYQDDAKAFSEGKQVIIDFLRQLGFDEIASEYESTR